MKRNVVFISVQGMHIPTLNDTLLIAIDTEGRVWTKMMFGNTEWRKEPTPIETIH